MAKEVDEDGTEEVWQRQLRRFRNSATGEIARFLGAGGGSVTRACLWRLSGWKACGHEPLAAGRTGKDVRIDVRGFESWMRRKCDYVVEMSGEEKNGMVW